MPFGSLIQPLSINKFILFLFTMLAIVSCGGGSGGSSGGGNSGGNSTAISATADTTAQSLTVGTAMTNFSPLTPSGGVTPYTYSYAGTLPTGLNFNTSTGVVSGTPSAIYSTANIVFSVRDTNSVLASTSSTVSFTVGAASSHIVATANTTPQSLTVGTAMTNFSPLTPSGGVTPYTYSYAGTLPTGLNFNTITGAVTGTPTATYSTANLFFSVQDANNVVANTMSTVSFSVVGPWTGTKQLGVAGVTTQGSSDATDSSGNVYVAGSTWGGLDGNTLTGTYDFYVTKYNSAGVKQYTRQLGVAGGTTFGNSVATDSSGNVYVAGYTSGGLDGNTLTGTQDFFVTKFNSTGVKQYTRQLGVAGANTQGNSVATDASGNVYVAGFTGGGLDGNTSTGTTDFFVTKYNSAGVKQYTKQLGGATFGTLGYSVATDTSGNVYVAGYTSGGLDGNTLTGTYYDFFLTKYNNTGVKQYTKQLGVASVNTIGLSVATDSSGNVYVAGETWGGLDSNTLTGLEDFFVTKYDITGVKQYTRQLGVAGASTAGNSVATDSSGNVYVAGYTTGGLDSNTLTGTADFYVTKYNSTGVKQYTRQLGVTGVSTGGASVATDTSGNVYVAGSTGGGLDGNGLTGVEDFFVTKYNSTGVKQ